MILPTVKTSLNDAKLGLKKKIPLNTVIAKMRGVLSLTFNYQDFDFKA